MLVIECGVVFSAIFRPGADAEVSEIRFADLEARARQAEVVICTLFASGFDAALVAEILEAKGFPGRLFVIIPPLPRPGIVLAELRAAAPSIMVEFAPVQP